ncbi:DUF3311 domain-containing protein [Halopenitus persicus]|uniref:DUF3311 domain-containing protein n=1 Tax=Halopenitus persicus TaxID=1048396 RepID=A0A1H3EGB6_9EURY|nr:DUF3311 domain-containing protein [Halopenitus persicus]QHS17524.1 DUF3311 domain-containing protein [haloarchaeon 3A1-DGR]SDX76969.1 Protein of unknown function [Halopenitus persicus]
MDRLGRTVLWISTFVLLVAFAVPWFLWGTDTVVAGLPIWLWWHIGWLGLCSVLFHRFTRGSWDRIMGLDPGDGVRTTTDRSGLSTDRGGTAADRRNGGDR